MSTPPDPYLRISNPESIVLRTHLHDYQVLAASHNPRTITEMTAFICHLRRQRLSLLIADLVARVRCQLPSHASTGDLSKHVILLDALGANLLLHSADVNPLRIQIRRTLWDLRNLLEPLSPSESLRTCLEVARSGFLDIPGRLRYTGDEAKVRSEMYALMVENVLLQELHSLRVLERQLNAIVHRVYPGVVTHALIRASNASALLGIDDYRVRGKTRLANAVIDVRDAILVARGRISNEVKDAIHVLHNALVQSLKTDLDIRRPAGQAMLLRPRMDDIPNFAVVNQRILRGGQPSSRGLEWLANYGVSLVIDLRGSDRQNQWEMPKCRLFTVSGGDKELRKEPMRICNIPIEDFQTPTLEQVFEFVELLRVVSAEKGVVFVHCKAGIGRTGTMIACWRIFHGENANSALAEETLYSEGGGGLRQEAFVRQFAALHSTGET